MNVCHLEGGGERWRTHGQTQPRAIPSHDEQLTFNADVASNRKGLLGNSELGKHLKLATVGKVLPLIVLVGYYVGSAGWAAVVSGLSLPAALQSSGRELGLLDGRAITISVVNAAGLIGMMGLNALIHSVGKTANVNDVMWWLLDHTLDDLSVFLF